MKLTEHELEQMAQLSDAKVRKLFWFVYSHCLEDSLIEVIRGWLEENR